MNSKSKIAIIAGLIAFIILCMWLLSPSKEEKSASTNRVAPSVISSDWDKRYELMSQDPNGLYLFNYLLKSHINRGQQVAKIDHAYSFDTIPKENKASYVFVGESFVLTSSELDTLLSHVYRGSKLFLAQHKLDEQFYNSLFDNIELSYDYNFATNVKSENSSYKFYFKYQNDTIGHKWRGYKNVLPIEGLQHRVLTQIGPLENSIAIQFGKGYIYLNATPEFYVNYQMQTKAGLDHSKIWINRIPENEHVYWLELGRFAEPEMEDPIEELFDEGIEDEVDDSYLQFIFSQKSLIYAMILLIFGVIMYVVFRAKRTQPVVPQLAKKKNMTLLFTDTITSIYFANRNPYVMLNLQKRNFYDAVQKHFFVDLSKRNEDKEIKALSQKSNISEKEIVDLIDGFETTAVSSVDENYMLDISQKLVSFYRRSGLISDKVERKIKAREYVLYREIWLSSILILLGVFTILLGLYFLIQSIGIGVALWPVGVVFLVYGSLRISKPILKLDDKTISYFPIFGMRKTYNLSDVNGLETNDKGAKITWMDGKSLTINYWELTKTDAEQFKRFVINQNKLKL